MLPVHVLVSRATAPFACFRARFRMLRESDRANRRSDSSAASTTRIRPTPSRVRIEAMKSTTCAAAHAASPRSMRTSPLRALPERALRAPVSQALLPSYSPSVSGAVSSRRRCRAPARHVSTLKRLRLDTASAGAPRSFECRSMAARRITDQSRRWPRACPTTRIGRRVLAWRPDRRGISLEAFRGKGTPRFVARKHRLDAA